MRRLLSVEPSSSKITSVGFSDCVRADSIARVIHWSALKHGINTEIVGVIYSSVNDGPQGLKSVSERNEGLTPLTSYMDFRTGSNGLSDLREARKAIGIAWRNPSRAAKIFQGGIILSRRNNVFLATCLYSNSQNTP